MSCRSEPIQRLSRDCKFLLILFFAGIPRRIRATLIRPADSRLRRKTMFQPLAVHSTYSLNIASGYQATPHSAASPRIDSAPGDCTAQFQLIAA